jgi:hypothetical protein
VRKEDVLPAIKRPVARKITVQAKPMPAVTKIEEDDEEKDPPVLQELPEGLLLRRFRVKPLAQVLLTFGLIFVFQDVALWIWGGAPVLLKKLPTLTGATNLFGFYYPTYRLLILLIGLVILSFLWWLLLRTRLGIFIHGNMPFSICSYNVPPKPLRLVNTSFLLS